MQEVVVAVDQVVLEPVHTEEEALVRMDPQHRVLMVQ